MIQPQSPKLQNRKDKQILTVRGAVYSFGEHEIQIENDRFRDHTWRHWPLIVERPARKMTRQKHLKIRDMQISN